MKIDQLASSNEKRAYTAAIMFNSFIYIFGGHNSGVVHSSCEKFNLESNSWEYSYLIPQAISWNMTSIINEKIILSGYHILKIYSFDGNAYQLSLNLSQGHKILMGNFLIVSGALWIFENEWKYIINLHTIHLVQWLHT